MLVSACMPPVPVDGSATGASARCAGGAAATGAPDGFCASGAGLADGRGEVAGVAVTVGLGRGVAVAVAVAGRGVAVAVVVAAGVAVAVCAVRFNSMNPPRRQVVVWVVRVLPTAKFTVAPSVPQPAWPELAATSITYVPVVLTDALPQVAEPIVAVAVVPAGAFTVPYTRSGGVAGCAMGVAAAGDGDGDCAPAVPAKSAALSRTAPDAAAIPITGCFHDVLIRSPSL